MKVYREIEIDVEIDIEFEDVLKYMNKASESEVNEMKDCVGGVIGYDNLYDREKVLILNKAMKKYNLDELIEKLEITQGGAL